MDDRHASAQQFEGVHVGMSYGLGTLLEIYPVLDKCAVSYPNGEIQHLKLAKIVQKVKDATEAEVSNFLSRMD